MKPNITQKLSIKWRITLWYAALLALLCAMTVAILASSAERAAMAYYESKVKNSPIEATDLMREASPLELGTALGTIINLWAKFYNIPKGEPEEKPAKGKGKKAKN